ncbi:hypothetical protein ACVWXM_002140 [Bradyrhizobium sp. GM7.3]
MVRAFQCHRRVGSQLYRSIHIQRLGGSGLGLLALKKLPQPSDFGYLFCGQYGGNNLRLRSSMYFVEMTLAGGLREETPDACV